MECVERFNSLGDRGGHHGDVALAPVFEELNAGGGAIESRPFSRGSLNLDTAKSLDPVHKRGQVAVSNCAYHGVFPKVFVEKMQGSQMEGIAEELEGGCRSLDAEGAVHGDSEDG